MRRDMTSNQAPRSATTTAPSSNQMCIVYPLPAKPIPGRKRNPAGRMRTRLVRPTESNQLLACSAAQLAADGVERVVDIVGDGFHASNRAESNECTDECVLDQVLTGFALMKTGYEGT